MFATSRSKFNILIPFIVLLGVFKVNSDNKEHVHLKIYVPELIKHHTHTKTVVIHVHHPPKKKEHPHKNLQYHNNDWSSWKTVNHHSGYQEDAGPHDGLLTHGLMNPYSHHQAEPPIPFYDDYQGHSEKPEEQPELTNSPPKMNFDPGTHLNRPHQYETYEEIDDIPQNHLGDSYEKQEHEQGHRAGHHVLRGHIHTDELKHFYDDKTEESAETFDGKTNEEDSKFYGNRHVPIIKMLSNS